jgi:hypothetical protein
VNLSDEIYLREIHQNLCHFVSSLTTAHINNNVAVGELRQRLTNDSLTASESTRDAHGSTLDTGKESVEHTLADDQWLVGRQLLGTGAGYTDGPLVHHTVFSLHSIELELQNLLGNGVFALLCDAGDLSASARRKQDLVVVEKTVLEDGSKHVASGEVVSDLVLTWCEGPLPLAVEGGNVDTARDVNAVRVFGDGFERTLDTVIDGFHETWPEFDGQRLSRSENGIAHRHTSYRVC